MDDVTTTTCETCSGTGSVIATRARWIGGTKTGYRSTWTGEVRCDECDGSGAVPAITCATCETVAPASGAVPTIDRSGMICETCYEAEQDAILFGSPELLWFQPWWPDPEVA